MKISKIVLIIFFAVVTSQARSTSYSPKGNPLSLLNILNNSDVIITGSVHRIHSSWAKGLGQEVVTIIQLEDVKYWNDGDFVLSNIPAIIRVGGGHPEHEPSNPQLSRYTIFPNKYIHEGVKVLAFLRKNGKEMNPFFGFDEGLGLFRIEPDHTLVGYSGMPIVSLANNRLGYFQKKNDCTKEEIATSGQIIDIVVENGVNVKVSEEEIAEMVISSPCPGGIGYYNKNNSNYIDSNYEATLENFSKRILDIAIKQNIAKHLNRVRLDQNVVQANPPYKPLFISDEAYMDLDNYINGLSEEKRRSLSETTVSAHKRRMQNLKELEQKGGK